MLSQFGIEASPAVTYAIAFAIIFVLLTLFALVLRRLTGGRSMLAGQGGRTRQPRLGIVDVYDLDRQRQLILLRRDNVEHLLLIGGPNDVVIETNIVRVPGARAQAASEHLPERIEAGERAPEAVPARPVVEALPLRAANEGGERGRGTVTALPTEAASVGASLQPSPTRSEAVLKPDVVAFQGGRATPRRPEAPPPPPAPAPRSEAPQRSAPIPPALTEPKPAPTPIPSPISEPKGPDAAILSDMAKQLEEALKRPMAPAKPPEPAPAPPPPPPPVRAEPAPTPARPPAPAPVRPPAQPPAPAPAQPPPPRAAQPAPVQKPPVPPPPPPPPAASPPPPPRPAAPPAPTPAPNGPAVAEAPTPKPAPRPEPPAVKPEAKPEPAAEPPRVSDPFSVEEIEAEFARLLGRPFDRNGKGDKA